MTKFEAMNAMRAGKKLTHRFFSPDEWVTIQNEKYLFEDGVQCSYGQFWQDRCGDEWLSDWEEWKSPVNRQSSTNSEFGSYHWFHTLIARHKDIGEFLKEKTPDEALLRIWGEELYKNSQELIKGYPFINARQPMVLGAVPANLVVIGNAVPARSEEPGNATPAYEAPLSLQGAPYAYLAAGAPPQCSRDKECSGVFNEQCPDNTTCPIHKVYRCRVPNVSVLPVAGARAIMMTSEEYYNQKR